MMKVRTAFGAAMAPACALNLPGLTRTSALAPAVSLVSFFVHFFSSGDFFFALLKGKSIHAHLRSEARTADEEYFSRRSSKDLAPLYKERKDENDRAKEVRG